MDVDIKDCATVVGKSVEIYKLNPYSFNKVEGYYGWDGYSIPMDVMVKEPILKKLHEKYRIKLAGFITIEPFTTYDWHTDTNRGVSINMIMTPNVNSVSMFGKMGKYKEQHKFTELKYQPQTFYAFNNNYLHQVINFDKPRVMFSLEFELDKNILSYQRLVGEL
jgi:hypothetical protein